MCLNPDERVVRVKRICSVDVSKLLELIEQRG